MADYCTIDDITADGRLNITVTDYDAELSAMITGVSRAIDQHYGVVAGSFAQDTDDVRYFDYDSHVIHGRTLVLDMPIVSVTSIVNGDADATVVSASDYRLHPRNGRWYNEIRLLANAVSITGWSFTTDGEIVITGKWGFATTVPNEIREATAYWCAWLLKNYQSGLQDSTANLELGSVSYTKSMPEPVKKFLPSYRLGFG